MTWRDVFAGLGDELADLAHRHWRFLAACAAAFVAGLLVGCGTPARAEGPKKPTVNAVTVTVAGDTVRVKARFRTTVAVDSIVAHIQLPNSGKPYANFRRGPLAAGAVDSIAVQWVGVPAGTYTGNVVARSYRAGAASPQASKGYSVTVQQGPPPPPIIDTVEVSALKILPDAWTMKPRYNRTLCLAAEFPFGGAELWGEHAGNGECAARLNEAYPNRRAATAAELAFLATTENCYPLDGQDPANGVTCKRRGLPT